VASASVYLPAVRFRAARREETARALAEAGAEISRRLTATSAEAF
jgi:DNA-binding IclR family transcriptional regulator